MTSIEVTRDGAVLDEGWYEQPRRWLQLNLVPDDPLHADVEQWQRYWREAHVEGLTISAGGATAFYPTDIPLHQRAAYLGDRDLFGELLGAAKELGIRVLARIEATMGTHELAEARPDWITKRESSVAFDIPGVDPKVVAAYFASMSGGRPAPCFNGPYFREFLPRVMTEIAERYPIDGFYANGWPFIGGGPPKLSTVCSCVSCVDGWRARGHDALPTDADPHNAEWAEYVTYIQESYEDVQQRWQEHVKSIRPELSFVCNLHGSLASGVRWREFGRHIDLFVNDSQARHGVEPFPQGVMTEALWSPSRSAAVIQAVANGSPTCHIVGGWHAGLPPLRRLGKEPGEITLMLAQVVARGARPWCNVAGGTIYDRRWMAPIRDYYAWHSSIDRYLDNTRSLAGVGIVWTPHALWPEWSDRRFANAGPSLSSAVHGWHETLLRARRPFDIVPDHLLADRSLAQYRVLIVPSGSRVDLAGAEALRRFVEDGGGLVLGCGTLQPAAGPAGGEALLAELAGIGPPGAAIGPRPSAYVELTSTRDHELFRGAGDTDYLPAGNWWAPPSSPGEATGAGRFQQALPFLADLAYVDHPPPDDAVMTLHRRCVYLGTDLDALHGGAGLPDARLLLTNAIDTVFGPDPRECSVTGPGTLDVNVWEQRSSTTVHLVNLTNTNLYGGPVDELVPVGPQHVIVRVPPSHDVARVVCLRAGIELQFERSNGGALSFTVPSITDFEVVAIDRSER